MAPLLRTVVSLASVALLSSTAARAGDATFKVPSDLTIPPGLTVPPGVNVPGFSPGTALPVGLNVANIFKAMTPEVQKQLVPVIKAMLAKIEDAKPLVLDMSTFTQNDSWAMPAAGPRDQCKCTADGNESTATSRRAEPLCDCPAMQLPPGVQGRGNPGKIMKKLASWAKPRVPTNIPEGCPIWMKSKSTLDAHAMTKVDAAAADPTAVAKKLIAVLGSDIPKTVVKAVFAAVSLAASESAADEVKALAKRAVSIAAKIVVMDDLHAELSKSDTAGCAKPKPQKGKGAPRKFQAKLADGVTTEALTEKLASMTGLSTENIIVTLGGARRRAAQQVTIEFKGADAGYASSIVDYMDEADKAEMGIGSVVKAAQEKTPSTGCDSSAVSVSSAIFAAVSGMAAMTFL